MDFTQLKYMQALAEMQSLTKVADHFFTSHQGVKNAIKNLENELNVALLETSNHGSKLTAAGLIIAENYPLLETQYNAMMEQLQPFRQTQQQAVQPLHLYAAPGMANDYFFDIFDAYAAHTTSIQLLPHVVPLEELLRQNNFPEQSIGLAPISEKTDDYEKLKKYAKKQNLRVLSLGSTQSYICIHKNSKYAKRQNISLAELDIPIYIFLHFSNTTKTLGKDIQYFTDFNSLKRSLKNKPGAAIMKQCEFDYFFKKNYSEFRLFPLEGSETTYTALVTENTLNTSAEMQDFIRYLRKALAEELI